jgi:hypothetical protein
MSARAAGFAVSAQVKAEEGITSLVKGFADMLKPSAVITKSMGKTNDRPGFSFGFPSLYVDCYVIIFH